MPPIIYLNEISDKEKLFINLSIYALWIFYFYEFGSFMKKSFMLGIELIEIHLLML